MDDVDLAQEREEAHLAASLAARKTKLTSPNGLCVWCKDEAVVAETAFAQPSAMRIIISIAVSRVSVLADIPD